MKVGFFLLSALSIGSLFAVEPKLAPVGSVLEADVVGHYVSATHEQQNALRGASMEVDIDASVPKLKREGKLRALRSISQLGKVTYHVLGFNGDNSVKKDVIARYLSAEVQSQNGPNIAITPDNYKFKLKGLRDDHTRPVYVLAIAPRKKRVGLFKGEIWVDQQTGMPVREAGRFVKSPSVFLGKMEFVRTYDIHDGVAVPQHLESKVSTHLFGPVELTINFTHFSKDPETASSTVASISDTQD